MNIEFEKVMIKKFFEDRTAISVLTIEREAGIPVKTLDHFLKNRRDLTEKNLLKLIKILQKYGYEKK